MNVIKILKKFANLHEKCQLMATTHFTIFTQFLLGPTGARSKIVSLVINSSRQSAHFEKPMMHFE